MFLACSLAFVVVDDRNNELAVSLSSQELAGLHGAGFASYKKCTEGNAKCVGGGGSELGQCAQGADDKRFCGVEEKEWTCSLVGGWPGTSDECVGTVDARECIAKSKLYTCTTQSGSTGYV